MGVLGFIRTSLRTRMHVTTVGNVRKISPGWDPEKRLDSFSIECRLLRELTYEARLGWWQDHGYPLPHMVGPKELHRTWQGGWGDWWPPQIKGKCLMCLLGPVPGPASCGALGGVGKTVWGICRKWSLYRPGSSLWASRGRVLEQSLLHKQALDFLKCLMFVWKAGGVAVSSGLS